MALGILINGMILGAIYAILTLGFSLVFGVAKVFNLAHTGFYMVAGFLLYTVSGLLKYSVQPSAILAIFITAFFGMICYRLVFDRIKEHETAVMLIAIALAMLFQEVITLIFGADFNRVEPFIPGFFEIQGIRVSFQHLLGIVTSMVALGGVGLMLSKTRLGRAIRAVSQDREIANVMGIDVSRICLITMGISTGLAGIACVVVAPIFMVHSQMWLSPLPIVLASVVLGGLGSIKGSIIAAFMLGFAETTIVFLIPGGAFIRGAVSLGTMVIVLLIRPEGLFGVLFEEERL
jgi:branched-chain amino acid transport system permease protein